MRGGPKVKAAASAGFGTKLIDHIVRHDLDGSTKIHFDRARVRWSQKRIPRASLKSLDAVVDRDGDYLRGGGEYRHPDQNDPDPAKAVVGDGAKS